MQTLSRTLAFIFGGFTLANMLGGAFMSGFDANHWWIDLRWFPPAARGALLACFGVLLIAFAVRPHAARWRILMTRAVLMLVLALVLANIATVWLLHARGWVDLQFAMPFSLMVAVSIALVGFSVRSAPANTAPDHRSVGSRLWAALVAVTTTGACICLFALGQMFCFGKTDYSRPADAIVVFGARAYADGRPSTALADRVRTACDLYHRGLANQLVFSGGPGDGAIHETESMRRMALELGVPDHAILRDEQGLNTRHTARNTIALFKEHNIRRVLAVSHFYHLPRVKMTYQQEGFDVYTVPARETYTLTQMPYLIAREIAALGAYYLAPLTPDNA